MYKFNIGEVVSIIDPGKTYTTNGEKFIEFGFTNAIENRYVPEGRVGVIFARGYHQDGMTELYGINILKNDDPFSLEV